MKDIGKALVALILVVVGIAAGLVSACGGIFTLVSIAQPAFLVISLPSLLIGGVIAFLCMKALDDDSSGSDSDPSADDPAAPE